MSVAGVKDAGSVTMSAATCNQPCQTSCHSGMSAPVSDGFPPVKRAPGIAWSTAH